MLDCGWRTREGIKITFSKYIIHLLFTNAVGGTGKNNNKFILECYLSVFYEVQQIIIFDVTLLVLRALSGIKLSCSIIYPFE